MQNLSPSDNASSSSWKPDNLTTPFRGSRTRHCKMLILMHSNSNGGGGGVMNHFFLNFALSTPECELYAN